MLLETFREDEIQVLIALIELSEPIETPNNNFYSFYPKDLAAARTYFRDFALDLAPAFERLVEKGLLTKEKDLCLTPPGKDAARAARYARPPIWYWYKAFYRAIATSATFAEYCQRVFGQNLGQHGFSDMRQIERMLAWLKPCPGEHLLDIGCGNGGIAEYISERSGARVTGIDYIPEAVDQARRRTELKSDRLRFEVCSIDELHRLDDTFDGILSIDSIFFGQNLAGTLRAMKARLAPGGRMAVFCADDLTDALSQNDLSFEREDLSRENYEHLQHKGRVAREMRAAFEAEGNLFIWENLVTESIADSAPYDPDKHSFERYLYHVQMKASDAEALRK